MAQGCDGLGWAAGPPVGGLLFVAGGFRLPFICFGAAPALGLLAMLLTAPKMQPTSPASGSIYVPPVEPAREGCRATMHRLKVVLTVPVIMMAPTALVGMLKWGAVDLLLAEWLLADFDLTVATGAPQAGGSRGFLTPLSIF